MSERIGFVGLGVMGRPMAMNLLRAGRTVVAHTRDAVALAEVGAAGAEVAGDPRDAAARSDVVVTMLPNGEIVEDVVAGPRGILAGTRPGQLVIDMSTIDPGVSRRLATLAAKRDVRMLDAPVSGGDVGAQQGTLSIMVGGDAADVERARPIFEILGKTVVHVGPHGAGQVVKACNQVVVGITFAAVAEALVLGSKSGVAPELILDVLSGGLAANRVMEVRRRNFLEHDFTPGFRVDLHHKDLGIALRAGGAEGVSMPLTALVQQQLNALRAGGGGDLDHSSLLTVVETLSSHRIGPKGGV
ncbi:2-hydroxy-3-oxopropionate reductase [Gaiella occulta]|uniref:2-hydroxy-3-oxopropionate reductase n=1 Tax=Gaiella occulta TaxID=1002870 RepID=A0A7M2YT99_9ACTN|nr:2-hydroxy-3-oxopropionate reductase [Gaiella occulta]RDI73255.1 2-hydroxy-3-oxopropionate reductase [Gaiella occulta]